MTSSKVINDYIAGALGGAAGLVVGHPFDTTKVQMQTQQTATPYKGTLDAMKNINHQGWVCYITTRVGNIAAKNEGLGFPLVSYGVVNSVFFGVYGNTLHALGPDPGARYRHVLLAGCVGGVAQFFVACPVDVVKIVLQSQIARSSVQGGKVNAATFGGSYFRGPVQCLRTLYRTGGIARCYKGYPVQLARDIPASGTYFLTYETIKDVLTDHGLTDSSGVVADLVAGGTAGLTSWTLIMPLDVIKSQIQADFTGSRHTSIVTCARTIYRTRGISGFFTGLPVAWLRAGPCNAVIFLAYNQSLKFLNNFA